MQKYTVIIFIVYYCRKYATLFGTEKLIQVIKILKGEKKKTIRCERINKIFINDKRVKKLKKQTL